MTGALVGDTAEAATADVEAELLLALIFGCDSSAGAIFATFSSLIANFLSSLGLAPSNLPTICEPLNATTVGTTDTSRDSLTSGTASASVVLKVTLVKANASCNELKIW